MPSWEALNVPLHLPLRVEHGSTMTAVPYTYEPTPKQALAHSIVCDELLFGGAAGGGKVAGGELRQSATAYSSPVSE